MSDPSVSMPLEPCFFIHWLMSGPRVSMPLEPSEARSVLGRRRNNYVVMGVMISFAVIVMAVMIWLKCMQYDLQSHTSLTCSCCRSVFLIYSPSPAPAAGQSS